MPPVPTPGGDKPSPPPPPPAPKPAPPTPRPPSPAWDPSGDPLHFIIELYDVLRGGYDRFLSLRPGDPQIAGERQALERLRHEVHRHIIHGPVRDAVVNRAVECLTRHYIERGQAYDPSEVTNLIGVGVMSPLMGLATLPPVHHADILGKRSEFDSEEARREWTVSVHRHTTQGECLGMGLQSRAELLTRMASLASSPADLQVRGVNGPGVVPFCTLPAVVPTYESGCVSRSGVEDEARRKGATPASDVTVAARETKQRLTREQREPLIESTITRLLGSGSDAEKADKAKPITLDRVAEESGVKRSAVDRSAAYDAFAKQYGKRRDPNVAGKQARAIPLTDQMLAAMPDARAADPTAEVEEAEELQQAEAQYRSSLSDARRRKHDAMSRDEQMMAVNDWRATQFLRACGHVD